MSTPTPSPAPTSDPHRHLRWRWRRARRPVALAAVAIVGLGAATNASALLGMLKHPGPQGDGTAVTPTGWHVTPAGRQTQLGERPYGLAISPDGSHLLVSNDGVSTQSVMLVDAKTRRVTSEITYRAPEAVYLGVAFSPDGSRAYVSAGANDKVRVYDIRGDKLVEQAPLKVHRPTGTAVPQFTAGLALSADGRHVFVADNLANAVSVLDTRTGAERRISLSGRACTFNSFGSDPSNGAACNFPYTVVLSRDGRHAYVSNWGKDYVSVIDVAAMRVAKTIRVGTHPTAMVVSRVRDEVYVANTDGDSISVIDAARNVRSRTFSVSPYPGARVGSQPNALALSPDGNTLYAANAGNNDVDVIRLSRGGQADRVLGLVPTGWYPTGVAVSPDGKTLYVENGKGLGAGPNPNGPKPGRDPESSPSQYIGSMIKGTLSTVEVPGPSQLSRFTRQVTGNNGFADLDRVRLAGTTTQHVVPRRVGQPSPIKHVIYVVNENRTYDQVLGDLGKGNGDPSITLFDRRSAPNHHRLAEQFTTLDNLYAAGEVSDDGWEWSTGANASTLDVKTQPTLYGGRGYFYVGEGGTLGAAPGIHPENSYIWDRLDAAGLSYRNYGFWATGTAPVEVYNEPGLDKHTDHRFPGFNMAISDQVRYQEWLREFRAYERSGQLPTVEFVKFPRDHTCGTSPSCPSPRAMMADSDWALGQLVDTVSRSKFWKDTAIFQIEDDAQDGPDHVDAHRTLGHVMSPYTRTGKVDSTFYSSVSMLRTMELILGLQPLTQFDAASNPMFNSFTDTADLRPYTAVTPRQSLTEPNPAGAPMAAESGRMDFSKEDRAPQQVLNEAIWKSVRGASSSMPAPVHRSGPAVDLDD